MMTLRSGLFAVLACATAVSLSAQTPPPSEKTPPSTAKQGPPSTDPANKIKVTGCVERAKTEASTPGTPGAAATDTTKFVLTNVAAAPSPAGTAGTTGSTGPLATSYRLDGEDARLTPHIGHRITVMGTVENRASATGASKSESAPKLKVEAVQMVSATCTP